MSLTLESGPFPSDDKLPKIIIIMAITFVPNFLLQPNSSENVETALSVRAIALVTAANNTSAKNRIPMILPKPMLAKIFGIVINIRDGPALSVLWSPPEKANTAGIIIRLAMMAIAVSKISTCSVDSSMLTSFLI